MESPPAPSPTAATTRFAPGAGAVPDVIVGGLLFDGTELCPLEKVSDSLVEFVLLLSLITADTDSVWTPSTHFVVGSAKV